MKTKFAQIGRDIRFTDQPPVIHEDLPRGYYTVEIAPMTGELYLTEINEFDLPDRLYGDITSRADRAIRTFADRSGTTGMLLNGEKGSGKTLLGKLVAKRLHDEQDLSVIVLNKPLAGDALGQFLQSIGRPFVLFLDEFEKVYSKTDNQNAMLTILDGVYASKMMAIITTNSMGGIASPLIDRPGRMYYRMDYFGLDHEFVKGYAEDNLNDKSEVDALVRLAMLTKLNFDQMQALVAEMNRFDESALDAIQFLNIAVDTGSVTFDIKGMEYEGKPVKEDDILSFSFELDMDGDPNNVVTFDAFVPNTEKLPLRDLVRKSDVRNAVSRNSYASRVKPFLEAMNQTGRIVEAQIAKQAAKERGEEYKDPYDAVPDSYPSRLAVVGSPDLQIDGDRVTLTPNAEQLARSLDAEFYVNDYNVADFRLFLQKRPSYYRKAI